MNRKFFVRVVAIGLAFIMILGVVAVAFPAFAVSPDLMMIANTGDTSNHNMMIIGAVIALVVVVALVILPKFTQGKK